MDPSDSFAWNEYLEKTGGTPAAWECFKQVCILFLHASIELMFSDYIYSLFIFDFVFYFDLCNKCLYILYAI